MILDFIMVLVVYSKEKKTLYVKIVLFIFINTFIFKLYFQHHEQVQKYSSTLEGLLFTQDLDIHILEVFHQFLALRS